MRLGMIGLGKMGANMTRRLLQDGHEVVGYDRSPETVASVVKEGAESARSLEELKAKLVPPRVVWVMVPSGKPIEETVKALGALLDTGDICVDGGNSNYRESMGRAEALAEKGIRFADAGTSGGIWGLKEGYCLMVGGAQDVVEQLRPALQTLAPGPDRGWAHVGPAGAGHFVKMVHNGVEYGMMQALAEGFAVLERKKELELDLAKIAELWRHGSVVRSWLLDLTARALEESPDLAGIAPWVSDSGEGRWTVFEAIDLDVPAPVITLSLLARLRSREPDSFADKLLAAMRNQFGGHAIKADKG